MKQVYNNDHYRSTGWSNGLDSNQRLEGFAVLCIGPLCHRCVLLAPQVRFERTTLALTVPRFYQLSYWGIDSFNNLLYLIFFDLCVGVCE